MLFQIDLPFEKSPIGPFRFTGIHVNSTLPYFHVQLQPLKSVCQTRNNSKGHSFWRQPALLLCVYLNEEERL